MRWMNSYADVSDCVHTAAESPNRTPLASSMAWSTIACRQHREHRTEDLFLRDAHGRLDIRQHRRRREPASRVSAGREPFAAALHRRALALTDADVLEHGLELLLVDRRTDLDACLETVADLQPARPLDERLGERVENGLFDDDTRGGRAPLPGREERRVHDNVDGVIDERVGQDDRRILAAHLELHARSALGGLDRDPAARPFRASERDRAHVLGWSRFRARPDEPGPVTRFNAPFVTPASSSASTRRTEHKRRKVGRLQHDAVAADQRRRGLPGGNRNREVPRRDQSDDAERVAGAFG